MCDMNASMYIVANSLLVIYPTCLGSGGNVFVQMLVMEGKPQLQK